MGALATPVVMGILSFPFFGILVFSGQNIPKESLGLIVSLGALQGMLSKATKNALFDPTIQMAYVPLDQASAALLLRECKVSERNTLLLACQESKVKGKAAIDVLGSRLGKSGCALLQQSLVFAYGTIQQAAPIVMAVFYTVSLP